MTNRDILIHAAAVALEERSVEALTVREVAKRAKQSTIGIYRHFSGKDGLLDALFRSGFARLGEAAKNAGMKRVSARDAVAMAVKEYLRLSREQPQHYRLMFAPSTAGFEPTNDARSDAVANYDSFVDLVRRVPGVGEQARKVAADIFALVHGHVALRAQKFVPSGEHGAWEKRILASVERQLDLLEIG